MMRLYDMNRKGDMLSPYIRRLPSFFLPWIGISAGAITAGAMLAGKTDAVLGQTPTLILLALAMAVAGCVIFGTVGFPVLVAWPVVAGLAYPFVVFPKAQPLITFDRLWILGMVGCLALGRRELHVSPASRRFSLALAIFVAVYATRALTTEGGGWTTLRLWLDALLLPLLLFLSTLLFVTTRRRAEQLAAALMVGGGILAAVGIADLLLELNLAMYRGGSVRVESGLDTIRPSGPYPAPEPYALSLLVCLAATLYWIQARGHASRVLGTGFALLQLSAVGLTLFRAAWIGALLVIIGAFALRRGRPGRLVLVSAVLGLAVVGGASQLQDSALFRERVDNIDNIWGRLATYEQGIEIFRSSPIIGIGVERYHEVSELLPQEEVHGVGSVSFAHSSFVGILAEQGAIAFLAFLAVCITAWQLIRALARQADSAETSALAGAAAGAALAYLIMSLTLTMLPYGPSNAFFAILLGLVAARLDAAEAVPGAAEPTS